MRCENVAARVNCWDFGLSCHPDAVVVCQHALHGGIYRAESNVLRGFLNFWSGQPVFVVGYPLLDEGVRANA